MWCLLEFLFQSSESFPCLPLAVLKCAQPMLTFTFPVFSRIVSHAVHPSAQHLAICTCFLWSIGFHLYWYIFLTSSLIHPLPPIFSFSFICGRRSSLNLFLWFFWSIDLVLWILFWGSPGLFDLLPWLPQHVPSPCDIFRPSYLDSLVWMFLMMFSDLPASMVRYPLCTELICWLISFSSLFCSYPLNVHLFPFPLTICLFLRYGTVLLFSSSLITLKTEFFILISFGENGFRFRKQCL